MKKSFIPVFFVFNLSFLLFSQRVERKYVDKYFLPTDSISASYIHLRIHDATLDDKGVLKILDNKGNVLRSSEYSSFSQEILHGESITYYVNSSQMRSVKTYENDNENGLFEYYFNDGSLQAKGFKRDGLLTDSLISFYPNGLRKRAEKYQNGGLVGGKCYDSLGRSMEHVPFETEAEFPGGYNALTSFIQRTLVYPNDAIDENISGKVYALFTVDSLGHVSNIEIKKGCTNSMNNEVIRVIKQMPTWVPATFDGEALSSIFRLPVTFELVGSDAELICMDYTLRESNLHWKSKDVVLNDAFSGESIRSFSRGNKSYFKLYLLHAEKENIRRKKIEFSELENRNAFKFNTRRNARRFRRDCI